jgi:hypothetical protein
MFSKVFKKPPNDSKTWKSCKHFKKYWNSTVTLVKLRYGTTVKYRGLLSFNLACCTVNLICACSECFLCVPVPLFQAMYCPYVQHLYSISIPGFTVSLFSLSEELHTVAIYLLFLRGCCFYVAPVSICNCSYAPLPPLCLYCPCVAVSLCLFILCFPSVLVQLLCLCPGLHFVVMTICNHYVWMYRRSLAVPVSLMFLCPCFSCAPSQLLASSFAPLLLLCPCACRSCLPCSWCPRSLAVEERSLWLK